MKTEEFDYDLPDELIAKYPAVHRDESRLLVYERANRCLEHCRFSDLPKFLKAGDVLVLNNTEVIPARLKGFKDNGVPVEVFLVEKQSPAEWRCMVFPGKRLKPGAKVRFSDQLQATIVQTLDHGQRLVRFEGPNVSQALDELGSIPLPPYLNREFEKDDQARYQTVFASQKGAVAAPTAGLHFTDKLLETLQEQGVQICELTLHVGPGTFKPVSAQTIEEHRVDAEYYEVSANAAESLEKAKQESRRVIAVGTTSTRSLESLALKGRPLSACSEHTDLYIYPPFQFGLVDGLITNFHLPKSSLLALVSAFASRDEVLSLYEQAIAQKYRFYSYGDAMLIL